MLWRDVLREMTTVATGGSETAIVSGVQYDSRQVAPGDLFVAMRGESTDANRYVEKAVRDGAAALVMDSPEVFARLKAAGVDAGLALVEHGRRALSEASRAVLGHPEQGLALSAVTGTNGKTTTAWVLEQMLVSVGRRAVLVGTIETHVAGEVFGSPHTTPESRDLIETFSRAVRAGCTEAVIEASSHALEQERTWGLPVDVAIWTNLTQDHLDYHRTMDHYFEAKARLFHGVGTPPPRVAVLNVDDEAGRRLLRRIGGSAIMTYGLNDGDYRAEDLHLSATETRFVLHTPDAKVEVRSPLIGRVNAYNVIGAACAALARGLTRDQVVAAVARLRQVPGRFQIVRAGRSGVTAVVDYAHTEDALRNLITLGRELVGGSRGKVITVFGCGGDRDRSKRAKMGRTAAHGSDLVVVTSDNPRSEDPAAILDEIMVGVAETTTTAIVEEDRAGAIAIALRAALPGDLVLIAGKGHEQEQTLREGTIAFSDVAIAEDLLREMA